ncbi:hypothetical protein D3C72_2398180 [compost metagenome]
MLGVQRFLENTAVELQPGKFAVDEAFRAGNQLLEARGRLNFVGFMRIGDLVHAPSLIC